MTEKTGTPAAVAFGALCQVAEALRRATEEGYVFTFDSDTRSGDWVLQVCIQGGAEIVAKG